MNDQLELVSFHDRPDKNLAAGGRCLDRVAEQDLREMPQRVGIDRAGGCRLVDLAGEPDIPRGTFVLKVAQARAQKIGGTTWSGPRRREDAPRT